MKENIERYILETYGRDISEIKYSTNVTSDSIIVLDASGQLLYQIPNVTDTDTLTEILNADKSMKLWS